MTHIELVPYIQGDGIGADIWPVAQQVFDAAIKKVYGDEKSIFWLEVLAGEKAFEKTGEWLPQETLEILGNHQVAIKGPSAPPPVAVTAPSM